MAVQLRGPAADRFEQIGLRGQSASLTVGWREL